MANRERRELVHKLQRACRRRLEVFSWSRGVALRDRIVEGARPGQLRAGAKVLAQRAIRFQRLKAA